MEGVLYMMDHLISKFVPDKHQITKVDSSYISCSRHDHFQQLDGISQAYRFRQSWCSKEKAIMMCVNSECSQLGLVKTHKPCSGKKRGCPSCSPILNIGQKKEVERHHLQDIQLDMVDHMPAFDTNNKEATCCKHISCKCKTHVYCRNVKFICALYQTEIISGFYTNELYISCNTYVMTTSDEFRTHAYSPVIGHLMNG